MQDLGNTQEEVNPGYTNPGGNRDCDKDQASDRPFKETFDTWR